MGYCQRVLISLIRRYQKRGGGTHQFGVSCNFTPTCSEYAAQAITQYGAWKGSQLALQRLRRCNIPDQVGHIDDPVP